MLPRLAATVCHTTTGIIFLTHRTAVITSIASGTKTMSDTSFVISIDEKKQLNIKNRPSLLDDTVPLKSLLYRSRNSPLSLMPATIDIRQKSRSNSGILMLPKSLSSEKGTKHPVAAANTTDTKRSGFFLIYVMIFKISDSPHDASLIRVPCRAPS